MHTDQLDWSLPAHRRGTLSGMDAAPEPTWTYLRRVLRWWPGKGPAASLQITPCNDPCNDGSDHRLCNGPSPWQPPALHSQPAKSGKPLSPRRCPRSTHPGWRKYSHRADRYIPGSADRLR
ncbi:hypothetical protein XspCFBP7912_00730 [Xanthomonas sp. CFBP 7912]|nr:hypothetical protein XspCFBP7912_00730 [Xanthomonas sp. CFBP 7912]RJS04066.1 hypothetical protein XnspCFBP7698_13345 [Xanthomonas sp. CFBP 7698]